MKNLYKNVSWEFNFFITENPDGWFEFTVRETYPDPKKLFMIHISRNQKLDMKKQMEMNEEVDIEDLPF